VLEAKVPPYSLGQYYLFKLNMCVFQNQPALEKDRYRIRQAFVAAPGNSLIVADYGQVCQLVLNSQLFCPGMAFHLSFL
jgi:hypothetical protein